MCSPSASGLVLLRRFEAGWGWGGVGRVSVASCKLKPRLIPVWQPLARRRGSQASAPPVTRFPCNSRAPSLGAGGESLLKKMRCFSKPRAGAEPGDQIHKTAWRKKQGADTCTLLNSADFLGGAGEFPHSLAELFSSLHFRERKFLPVEKVLHCLVAGQWGVTEEDQARLSKRTDQRKGWQRRG